MTNEIVTATLINIQRKTANADLTPLTSLKLMP